MTTITIVPNFPLNGADYRAVAGAKQSVGRTPGEALDVERGRGSGVVQEASAASPSAVWGAVLLSDAPSMRDSERWTARVPGVGPVP